METGDSRLGYSALLESSETPLVPVSPEQGSEECGTIFGLLSRCSKLTSDYHSSPVSILLIGTSKTQPTIVNYLTPMQTSVNIR